MSEPSDPKRLADDAPSSELGRLMASATRDVPSDEELAGLAERLGAVLGPAPAAPAPPGSSVLVKLGVATGIAALIAGGVLALRAHSTPRSSQSATASASPPPAVSPSLLDTRAEANLAPTPAPPVAAPSAGSSPAHSASPLTKKSSPDSSKSSASAADGPSEARLLEQARRVLQSDPASALGLTNQDATLFPHGALVQEREVIAIEALRRLNRTVEADRRAAAFSKAFPGSAHQRVVEDAATK